MTLSSLLSDCCSAPVTFVESTPKYTNYKCSRCGRNTCDLQPPAESVDNRCIRCGNPADIFNYCPMGNAEQMTCITSEPLVNSSAPDVMAVQSGQFAGTKPDASTIRELIADECPEGAKLIPLTKGKSAVVDADDYEWLSKRVWITKIVPRKNAPPRYYAESNERRGNKYKRILMHRLITRAKKGEDVDHRNGNGIDNRRCNLRRCTRQENMRNSHVPHGASRYKGVSIDSDAKHSQWAASIETGSGQVCLGRFLTEEEAAIAYDYAALEIFGEFAVPNIMPRKMYEKLIAKEQCLRLALDGLEKIAAKHNYDSLIAKDTLTQIQLLTPKA